MKIARVVGEVVATTKHGDLHGQKLLLVQPVTPDDAKAGAALLAVDSVQAGVGDRVLVNDEGNGAAQVLRRARGAVRAVIVGVVDAVDRA
jgi:ethanolamine utilization protein EutN